MKKANGKILSNIRISVSPKLLVFFFSASPYGYYWSAGVGIIFKSIESVIFRIIFGFVFELGIPTSTLVVFYGFTN